MGKNRGTPDTRLVYSTDIGRIKEQTTNDKPIGDGNVRVRLEKKGRGGKVVTVISGLPLNSDDLKSLAKQLKHRCGGGGAVKGLNIELQGDHADMLVEYLKKSGFDAKRSGG